MRIAYIKKTRKETKANENVEKMKLLLIASRNVSWSSLYGKCYGDFPKNEKCNYCMV